MTETCFLSVNDTDRGFQERNISTRMSGRKRIKQRINEKNNRIELRVNARWGENKQRTAQPPDGAVLY